MTKNDVTDCTSNLKVNSSVGLLLERGIDRPCLVIAFKNKCQVGSSFLEIVLWTTQDININIQKIGLSGRLSK